VDTTDQTLNALLQAMQNGCVASFERLYGLTSPRLFGIVLRIHPDSAEAEDVLQDVYLKVWCRCAQFDADKGSVMHWLSGIARYSAIDGHRQRTSRPSGYRRSIGVDDDPDPYADIESIDLQPLDLMIRERSTAAVREGLRLLSNEQRESLTLAYCDGLSHAQIASRMGQPVGTVKSWLRRAHEELRPALAAYR
jgi:RNA polymerase sigma-70 factor (ECF subfamily)